MLKFKDGKEVFGRKDSEESLEIVFCGDYCPGTKEARELVCAGKSDEILKEVKPVLSDSDLSVIQFEFPLTEQDTPILKSGPNLKAPASCIDFVKKGGFDVTLLANNHIGDLDTQPVIDTISILRENGFKTVGAGKNSAEAEKALIFEKNGIKIGIINVAENEFGGAGPEKPGANPLNPPRNISTIMKTSAKVDIVIVVIHGGNEGNPFPTPRMVDTYRAFADAGATAVISVHTHCPEGIEIWNGVPVVYSLGNFYFPYPDTEYSTGDFWWKGYMLKIKFDKSKAYELEVIPTAFGPDEAKITLFDEAGRGKFYQYLTEISEVIQDRKKLKSFFDAVCAKSVHGRLNGLRSYLEKWPEENNPEQIKTFLDDPVELKKLLVLRNLLTCETHHEMFANIMRIIEEKRLDEAIKSLPEYAKYQIADFGF